VFGACVKPELYLCYAAAAVSMAAFAAAKASSMQSIHKELQTAIIDFTKNELETLLKESKAIVKELAVDKILHGEHIAFSTDDFNVATATVSNLLSASQGALDSFGLVDLDLQTISKLLALDPEAMTAVGLQWGINPDVLGLVMAGARRNEADVIRALSSLCASAKVKVEPETISAIIAVVKSIVNMKPGKSAEADAARMAFNFALKELVNTLVDPERIRSMLQQIAGASANSVGIVDLPLAISYPDRQQFKGFLGQAIDTLLSMVGAGMDADEQQNDGLGMGTLTPFSRMLERVCKEVFTQMRDCKDLETGLQEIRDKGSVPGFVVDLFLKKNTGSAAALLHMYPIIQLIRTCLQPNFSIEACCTELKDLASHSLRLPEQVVGMLGTFSCAPVSCFVF
jgi:hypothetical protein